MIGQHRMDWNNADGMTMGDLRALVGQADLVGMADSARVGARLRFGRGPSGTSSIKTLAIEGEIAREEGRP